MDKTKLSSLVEQGYDSGLDELLNALLNFEECPPEIYEFVKSCNNSIKEYNEVINDISCEIEDILYDSGDSSCDSDDTYHLERELMLYDRKIQIELSKVKNKIKEL